MEFDGSAGTLEWSASFGSATGTAGAPVVLLVLADSDDTGLDVVAKALLVASAPGTSPNAFYRDSDRGGTDTPLDGELGLGDDNTVISRFLRGTATELALNDNDNPASFNLGAYFTSGGDGEDLTLYFQTRWPMARSVFRHRLNLPPAAAILFGSPCLPMLRTC